MCERVSDKTSLWRSAKIETIFFSRELILSRYIIIHVTCMLISFASCCRSTFPYSKFSLSHWEFIIWAETAKTLQKCCTNVYLLTDPVAMCQSMELHTNTVLADTIFIPDNITFVESLEECLMYKETQYENVHYRNESLVCHYYDCPFETGTWDKNLVFYQRKGV